MIKVEPIKDYRERGRKDAINKAREALRRKIYELQFATLPKREQEALRTLGLDPESKNSEERIERR